MCVRIVWGFTLTRSVTAKSSRKGGLKEIVAGNSSYSGKRGCLFDICLEMGALLDVFTQITSKDMHFQPVRT
jgi:hypothetical protein